jgi:hypothetical protein
MRFPLQWFLTIVSLFSLSACAAPDACDHPEVVARWNDSATAAASPAALATTAVPVPPSGGGAACDVQWVACDQFPHPTFKYGTPEAYQCFAQAFIRFFDQPGNFEFLADNHLLGIRLLYRFSSGKIGIDTSFLELATQLSDPAYLPGFLPDDVRSQLASIRDEIQRAL